LKQWGRYELDGILISTTTVIDCPWLENPRKDLPATADHCGGSGGKMADVATG